MDDQELKNTLTRFHERIRLLEYANESEEAGAIEDAELNAIKGARYAALVTIVQEIAAHLGISEAQFVQHLQTRIRWQHDQLLRTAEDKSPNFAAQIDKREQGDVPGGEPPPPMFDPKE